MIFIYLQTFVLASRNFHNSLFSLILHLQVREGHQSYSWQLVKTELIVAQTGPPVLQFLKGVTNCITLACCLGGGVGFGLLCFLFFFLFVFLTGSRGQSCGWSLKSSVAWTLNESQVLVNRLSLDR